MHISGHLLRNSEQMSYGRKSAAKILHTEEDVGDTIPDALTLVTLKVRSLPWRIREDALRRQSSPLGA